MQCAWRRCEGGGADEESDDDVGRKNKGDLEFFAHFLIDLVSEGGLVFALR